MKKLLSLSLLLFTGFALSAQNEVDALRYSWLRPQGTARSIGMSGAFGALGADISTFSTNPAGIGLYRRNEFAFTPSVLSNSVSSNYTGTNTEEFRALMQISNIGIVGSYEGRSINWKYFNFGVGYNKLNSFQENFRVQGEVDETTLLDVFTEQAEGNLESDLYDFFPFGAALAYDAFLINPTDTGGVTTYSNVLRDGGFINGLGQIKNVERTGSMGETVLTGGANYNDRLFIGATLGFPNIRFREISTYTENSSGSTSDLNSWNYRQDLLTTGNGFNLKLGAIYRVNQWLRVGGAVHTPSWLNLRDTYETEATARFLDGTTLNSKSPLGSYEYNLRTPARYMLNTAFVLGKAGVISADYEYVDYSTAKLRSSRTVLDDYDFSAENSTISDIYRGTHNVRVGLEGRVAEVWRVRGGIGYQQSAYASNVTVNDNDIMSYSLGLGYRKGSVFVDLAYALSITERDYYLYDPSVIETANISKQESLIALTVGWRY